jgi:serine/threonine protein kinase
VRVCEPCGFENAEPGKACPLCGASEVRKPTLVAEAATLELPADRRTAGAPARGDTPFLGRVYADRYRLDALLGSGGMGQVYRAHDLSQGVDRALKVLRPETDDDPQRVERFRREIGVLSLIHHPAVPGILDWGAGAEALFFVTELVDGVDLKTEILRRGPWPVAEATPLAATVADALAAAHAVGIVHRDVKPNNIMIDRDGSVRLLDFGLARGVGIDMATLTRTGTIVGTPGYMSPEQFEGQGVDERSDLYSLGVVLFELLTARLPFTGQTPLAVALKHKTEAPPAPRALRRDLPAWLERVVLTCLEKEPARRFASAAELAAELRLPRSGRVERHRLPSGDLVIEDASGTTDWALVLASTAEKQGWTTGMALCFGGRHHKLVEILPPGEESPRWTYRFGFWPEGEVFRRLLDYEEDCAARAAAGQPSTLQRWLSGKKSRD